MKECLLSLPPVKMVSLLSYSDGPWISHLSSCHKERMLTIKYKSHFSNTLVHLGYHSDHNHRLPIDYQFTKFNQNILTCTISMSDLFIQPKMSGVCLRSNLHNVLQVFTVNLICKWPTSEKKLTFWPHLGAVGVYKGRIFACIVFSASFSLNSTCNMTTYRKKWSFDPPGVKDVCKSKTFACIKLYASFPFIWYATWQYSEKVNFIQAYVTPAAGPFLALGA